MNWFAGLLSIGINIDYDSGNRAAPTAGGHSPSDAQLAAEARAKRVIGYRLATNTGAKYKPNSADKELIGIQDAVLFWASELGVDNSTDDAGNSGLHLSIFDTSTRADSAQVELLNDSGDTQYIVAAAIKAKPIVRLSGEQGFTHDSFVDYQDIFLSGENQFEFGNNFVVTKAQLEQLADYYAKTLGVIVGDSAAIRAKHIYSVTIPGRCWWFEPGEWYTLQVGGAGQREYIDAVCECYSVQVEAAADGLGATRVDFREVEQNWVKDSNAVARFLATGDPRWKPNNFGRVVVAAKDYLGVADYYCDGTADQTEIQAAIDYLANAYGGGLVELTDGQFNVTAALEMRDNIILQGAGAQTIVEKNCNDYAIEAVGTSGTHKTNCNINRILFKRNAADTNAISILYAQYVDSLLIERNYFQSPTYDAITCDYCSGSVLLNDIDGLSSALSLRVFGIYVTNSPYLDTIQNTIHDIESSYGNTPLIHGIHWGNSENGNSIKNTIYNLIANSDNTLGHCDGIYYESSGYRTKINGNIISNIDHWSALYGSGIRVYQGEQVQIENNMVQECNGYGIYLGSASASCNAALVSANAAANNGNLIDRAACESATTPAISAEVAATLTQCTFARSAAQFYKGAYSYLLTKTVAAGTASTAYLTDSAATNDLHGLYASQEYRFGAWVYIPSGGMTGAELTLVIRDYVVAWEEEAQACANTYDAWQYVEVTKTLRAGSSGATFGFAIASTAANTETAYTDNLRLTPMGTRNLHNKNLFDDGSNTYDGL